MRCKAVPDTYREAGRRARGHPVAARLPGAPARARRTASWPRCCSGSGRAVGETMAVLMATGHAVHIPHGILDSVRTLTANIAAELGEAPAGSDHYRVLFLTGDPALPHHLRGQPHGGLRRPRDPEESSRPCASRGRPTSPARSAPSPSAQAVFALMAAAMVVPLLSSSWPTSSIRAWPSLGWEFLVEVPRRGMRDGGIWPAFVGTIYLVVISLARLGARSASWPPFTSTSTRRTTGSTA